MKTPASLLALGLLTGCIAHQSSFTPDPVESESGARRVFRADGPLNALMMSEPVLPDESLFPKDDAVLSDSAIRRILGHHFTLPAKTRVAVLQLGGIAASPWRWNESARLSEDFVDSIMAGLQRTPRVSSAAVLPSLLVPRERSVAFLREAAARFQADLLFVYRPVCTLLERTPIFGVTKYRTGCTVEALLLDTRSGIVPYSAVATRSESADRGKSDFNDRDAFQRAQYTAAREALASVIAEFGAFLERVPVSAGP